MGRSKKNKQRHYQKKVNDKISLLIAELQAIRLEALKELKGKRNSKS